MAVYSVEGKLGTGKTKFCVWVAQQAVLAGKRVASNVDLRFDKLTPGKRANYVRIPDKPHSADLALIGHGNPESYDEEKNGVLILDELGTWLNSRSFQDKDRSAVLDWLIHARKLGWDVYLIVQDAGMIDKQVREALVEYQCRCVRLDKVRIPIIGKLLGAIFGGRIGFLPRMHLVTARVGYGTNQVVAERWTYRGDDLHSGYDTRQIFRPDYPNGPHCVLPPWDHVWPTPLRVRIRQAWRRLTAWAPAEGRRSRPPPVPKLAAVAAIQALPAHERVRMYRQLQRRGAI